MLRVLKYIVILALTACSGIVHAQTFTFDTQSKYASGYNFNATDQFSYYVTLSLGASFTIKTSSANLVNGSNTIPVSNIKLQLTGIRNGGVSLNLVNTRPVVTLSTTPTSFYSGLSVSLLSTLYFSFNYQTAGGADFLNKPAGTYSTTLTFATGSTTMATGTLSVVINDVGTLTAGSTTLVFNTADAYKNGLQATQSNLLNNVFSNQSYKIMVKTQVSNITNGVNTIAADEVSAVIEPASAVSLATSNKALTGTISPTLAIQQYTVKFITQALRSAFINKPPGNYNITLIFSLADASNNAYPASLPAASSVTLTITLTNTVKLTLGSGADNALLAFASASDYKTGITLTQNNALDIFSNNPYVLTVKAATGNLTYLSSHIPVSNVYLLSTPSPSVPAIITTAISLSSISKTLADTSAAGLGTFLQNFNLKYYTQPLNSAFINLPAGTYSTTLTFTVTAP